MTKPLPPSKLVDIDLVQPNPGNVRRTKTDPAADDAFKESLRLQGQLQPVLVQPRTDDMPPENPDKPAKFQVVFGGRRLRLMREIGAKKISVIEADGISAANATAVSAIENMQRAAMHPVDIWTAMVTLQAQGMGLELAGQCLGVDARRARQLDRLGHIAPELIELMRENGIPQDTHLIVIANATPEKQVRAIKGIKGDGKYFPWHNVADNLRTATIPRTRAIFDLEKAKVAWQQDAFAQPGSPDEWTTTDAQAFLAAQQAALAARVAVEARKKMPVELVEWDSRERAPEVPQGYRRTYDKPRGKTVPAGDPRKRVVAVDRSGNIGEVVEIWVVKNEKLKAQKAAPLIDRADAEGGAATEPAAPETARITAAGREMIAAAKTHAIRDQLFKIAPEMAQTTLLRLLCVAICMDNVKVTTRGKWGTEPFGDLLQKLVLQTGRLENFSTIEEIAGEMIGRMVVVSTPGVDGYGSGPLAETIGYETSAEQAMGRFDTAEFLKTCRMPILEEARRELNLAAVLKTAGQLRANMEGKAESWRPPEAAFQPQMLSPPRPARPPEQDWSGDLDCDEGDGNGDSDA